MDKAPGAFRTISEVADEIDVPQHVLRFWESRFAQIRPMKRGGGRRFYRPEDVDLLRGVRHLLYGEGYTIRGVQRILREQGAVFVQSVWRIGAEPPPPELEEDQAGDESSAQSTMVRPQPDALSFPLASAGARERTAEQHPAERREPSFAVALSAPPSQPAGIAGDDRRRLRAALDELVACHRLIEAALADDDLAARGEADAPRPG